MNTRLILNQYRITSDYKDEIGLLYHFPKRYHKLLSATPSQFIYYEPRTGGDQIYFGTGVIRAVYEDTEDSDHYYAELSDYRQFSTMVDYYSGPSSQSWEDSKNMRNSVRSIKADVFDLILQAGGLLPTSPLQEWDDKVSMLQNQLRLEQSSTKDNPRQLRKIKRLIETFERPNRITAQVKKQRGHVCQLCKQSGFLMRNGRNYCEIHHLFHLSDNPPADCLEPFYLVVLCANCHRRMHYANVGTPILRDNVWCVLIDGEEHIFYT